MNRAALVELLRAFDAAGGVVELADGDLRLTSSKRAGHDLLGALRERRFDLVELLDGCPCTYCDRPIDRGSAPGRVLEPGLGAHHGCLAEHHAQRTAREALAMRRRLVRAG